MNALSAVLLVAFLYYFFRLLAGGGSERRQRMEDAVKRAKERAQSARKGRGKVMAEDMTQCSNCDAYIPKSNLTNCGKTGCPYGN